MEEKVPTALITSLRQIMASAIADFKAYDVPAICTRIGLVDGTEQEAFQSKFRYAQKRLSGLRGGRLIQCAQLLNNEENTPALGEVLAKINELNCRQVTVITRRRIIKIFDNRSLATEVEDMEVIRAIWPIALMSAPYESQYSSLEEFLIQHTVRNDDLSQKEVLEYLGVLDCSLARLFGFLEKVTSAEYQNPERQKELAKSINDILIHDEYSLVEIGQVSGSPFYGVRETPTGSPSDNGISKAIQDFEPNHIGPRWRAALESRTSDPERAITLARTLLEDVCKWILHESGETWEENDDLPVLYKRTAKCLNLAPDDHAEQIFKQILSGCQSVINALGALRNKLGDAHSIGPKRIRPASRHAELAVNLSGAMSTFLISTWSNNGGRSSSTEN